MVICDLFFVIFSFNRSIGLLWSILLLNHTMASWVCLFYNFLVNLIEFTANLSLFVRRSFSNDVWVIGLGYRRCDWWQLLRNHQGHVNFLISLSWFWSEIRVGRSWNVFSITWCKNIGRCFAWVSLKYIIRFGWSQCWLL